MTNGYTCTGTAIINTFPSPQKVPLCPLGVSYSHSSPQAVTHLPLQWVLPLLDFHINSLLCILFYSTCFWELTVLLYVSIVRFTFLLSSILVYRYTIIFSFVRLLVGIWIVCSFGPLWIKFLQRFGNNFSADIRFGFWGVDPRHDCWSCGNFVFNYVRLCQAVF